MWTIQQYSVYTKKIPRLFVLVQHVKLENVVVMNQNGKRRTKEKYISVYTLQCFHILWKIWTTWSLGTPIFVCYLGSKPCFCHRSPYCFCLLCFGTHCEVSVSLHPSHLSVQRLCSKEDVARTSLCLQPQADLGPLNTREYGTMCCSLTWEPIGFRTALGPEYHCAALVTTQHLGEIWFK